MTILGGRWREESGYGAVETAVIIPVVLLVVLVVIASGRVARATSSVDAAAYSAARAASISRDAGIAAAAARSTANTHLAQAGLTCAPSTVNIDTSGFAVPVGQPAQVRVTVRCTVPLADLGVPALGGSRTLVSTSAVSAIDTFRERR